MHTLEQGKKLKERKQCRMNDTHQSREIKTQNIMRKRGFLVEQTKQQKKGMMNRKQATARHEQVK